MSHIQAALAWGATCGYAVVTILFLYLVIMNPRERVQQFNLGALALSVALHLAALVYRSIESGHIPVKGRYENTATAALFIAIPALWLALRRPRMRIAAFAAIPFVLFLLGYGLTLFDPATPLGPPYKSSWLVIHVVFAQLAYGAFSLAVGSSIAWLLKARRKAESGPVTPPPAGAKLSLLDRLPDLNELDDLTFRYIVFGFVTCAMMIIAGAFWAQALWGKYWSWDPVETWSLITWLTYGLYIHLRIIHRWRDARMAWFAIAAIIFVIISYWGADYMSSKYHSLSDMPVERIMQ